MKRTLTLIFGFLLCAILLFTLTFRGSLGNPSPHQIETELSKTGMPFETSQERSRYAIILSMYHDRSFAIDNFASMGTPDIGYINGHYYSFFPPATSVLALPLFLLGQHLGMAQIMTFFVTTIFTLLTGILLLLFALKLKLHWSLALLAAVGYAFATNAWGYSVTLYAHPISAFFILLATYSTAFVKNWKGILVFWLCYAAGIYLDAPNIFIIFPLALVQAFRFFQVSETKKAVVLKLRWQSFFLPFVFLFLLFGYGYGNYRMYGSPTTLSNSIPRVRDLSIVEEREEVEEKVSAKQAGAAVSALNSRNMLEGFRSFIVSTDRGVLFFTPIALLSVLGIGVLKGKKKEVEILLLSVALTCLILYTMFGDPYGGWAFGSRYILAVMPEFVLLAVIGLARWSKNNLVKILYSLVFLYSSAISLLAPLTTNSTPPIVESDLGYDFTYLIHWEMIQQNRLSSFVYNHVLNQSVNGVAYYAAIATFVAVLGLALIWTRRGTYDAQ